MSLNTNIPPAPHPWLDRLTTEPNRAVDTLLRGAAYLPELQRATPSEALMALMGDKATDAPEWNLLDRALLQWLQTRRDAADEVLSRPGGMERFIRETGEAFRTVWRLSSAGRCTLPQSCTWIRAELFDLLRWSENFSVDATFDLSYTVLIAGAHLQEANEYRFLWLRICEEAAQPRLRHRLDAALLGLASIPTGKAGGPSHDLIVGLARWAYRLPHSDHFKNEVVREWRALKAAFPRQPSFWHGQWLAILNDERMAAHPFTAWLKESDPALQLKREVTRPLRTPQLPKNISSIILDMQQNLREQGLTPLLWQKMKDLLSQLESYADTTGENYFLVTSCTNIARIIVNEAPGLALTLTRRALLWAPANGYAWSIRATALDLLGRSDLAEAVLWEAMRRIPSNVVIYLELASKCVDRDSLVEAEALLRQALTLDPNDEPTRTELARVLWLQNHVDEAVEVLREIIEQSEVASYTLCSLYIAEGREVDATKLLDRCNQVHRITIKRLIAQGTAGQEEKRTYLRQSRRREAIKQSVVLDAEITEHSISAELSEFPRLEKISRVARADLLFQIGEQSREDALQLVDMALTDPADAYAQVVKGLAVPEYREEMQGRIGRFVGSLPVRLALTPENVNSEHWRELVRQFPEGQHLTRLMQLIRGQADDIAIAALKSWCNEPTHWDNRWDHYLKQTLHQYLDSDEPSRNLTTLAHNALTQAVDVGFNATPMAA
ncbi:MAG: tetratricopeptide repeat protein [Paucimonas sp.]|jgi:tetratricopeptide (TPR) repeat protein|nr:tetratricopeptide repeat protein [Paucimonas sp.]